MFSFFRFRHAMISYQNDLPLTLYIVYQSHRDTSKIDLLLSPSLMIIYIYTDTKSTYRNIAMKDVILTIFLLIATGEVIGRKNWSESLENRKRPGMLHEISLKSH